jgi:hypothetical protein
MNARLVKLFLVVLLLTGGSPVMGNRAFGDFVVFNFAENSDLETVTFTFNPAITEFHMDVSGIRADEYLTGFNIGEPTSLSGTLVNDGGLITTSGPTDPGSGRISFLNIHTTIVTFTVHNVSDTPLPPDTDPPPPDGGPDNPAIPHSPEPATLTLLGCSLGLLAARSLLRRRWPKPALRGQA